MAFSISYIVEIQDKYTKQLKKIANATCEFEKALEKTNKQMKKMAKLANKMKTSVASSVDTLSASQTRLITPLKEGGKALSNTGIAAGKYTERLKKIPAATNKAKGATNKFATKLKSLEKRLATAGYKFNNFGSIAGTVGGTVILKRVVGAFVEFDSKINAIQAVLELPIARMKVFRDTAKRLGLTTRYSATQVADAMRVLGMAGLSAVQIIDTIPHVLNLAAASEMDLSAAAEGMVDTMNQTNQTTADLAHITDVLAKGTTMAALTMDDMREAMRPMATTATNLGIPFEQIVTLIVAMAKAGERNSNAGTLMRNALVRMAGPSVKAMKVYKMLGINIAEYLDSMGKIKNYPKFIDMLRGLYKQGKLTVPVLRALFEERGYRPVQVFLNQSSKMFENFEDILNTVLGTSDKMAKTRMQGLPGVLLELAAAIEGVNIAMMESGLDIMLIDAGRKFRTFLQDVAAVNPKLLKFAGTMAMAAFGAAGLITVLGILSASASAILSLLMPALKAIGVYIGKITVPMWGWIAAAIALGAAVVYAWRSSAEFRFALKRLGGVIVSIFSPLTELMRILFATDNVTVGAKTTMTGLGDFLTNVMIPIIDVFTDALWLLFSPLILLGQVMKVFREKGFKGIFTPMIEELKILTGWVESLIQKFTKLMWWKKKAKGAPEAAVSAARKALTDLPGRAIEIAKMGLPDIVTPLKRAGVAIEKTLGVGERPSAEIIAERDKVIHNMLFGNIKIDVEGPGTVTEAAIQSPTPGNLGFNVGQ